MLVRAVVIRNNRAVAVFGVAIAAALAATSVLMKFRGLSSTVGLCYEAVSELVLLAIGIGLLIRPLGELTTTELTLRNLYGFRVRYPADQLRVLGEKVYCGKKTILVRWTVNRNDWQSLVQHLRARGA
jgi:hypothetical protein